MLLCLSIKYIVGAAALAGLVFSNYYHVSAAGQQSPFLKEILLGRCYDEHNKDSDGYGVSCPDVVGSMMSILESHPDPTIEPSNFDAYMNQANFDSPPNKAMFWLKFMGEEMPTDEDDDGSQFSTTRTETSPFVTPEDTPGSLLMKDLTFCGILDHRDSCNNIFESKAYWSFWEASYAEFASRARGDIHIVVEPYADIQFFIRSAVPHLQPNNYDDDKGDANVSTVTVFSEECTTRRILGLVSVLEKKGFIVTCNDNTNDFMTFQICQDPTSELCSFCASDGNISIKDLSPINNESTEKCNNRNDEQPDHHHHHHHPFFWMVIFAFIGWCCFKAGGQSRDTLENHQLISSLNGKLSHYNAVATTSSDEVEDVAATGGTYYEGESAIGERCQ